VPIMRLNLVTSSSSWPMTNEAEDCTPRARGLKGLYEFARKRGFFVNVGYRPRRDGYKITVQAGYVDGPPRPVWAKSYREETPIAEAIDDASQLPLDYYLGAPGPGRRS